MPLSDLVAHVRRWVSSPTPNRFYGRFLERVHTMPDDAIADAVRFAKTPRGAEMAIVRAVKPTQGA